MATTFILHGGRTAVKNSNNDSFFQAFTKNVEKDNVTILFCYFAREESEWKELFERDKKAVQEQTTKKLTFYIAEDSEDLLNMLKVSDVLYVAGGQAELIEPLLPELMTLKENLKDKVYIGSSMGAFIVSAHYVLSFEEQDSTNVHHGLGLLPLSTLCHWDVEHHNKVKLSLLKEAAPDIPILTLDEYKFAVFTH